MKKSVVIAAVAVVVVAAGAFMVANRRGSAEVVENEAVAVPVVLTETPGTGSIEVYRSLIGTVEPEDLVYVIPKTSGEISAVYVNVGDMVEEGQVLCDIDSQTQLDAAKLQLDSAEISLNDAQTSLSRMSVLYSSGDISAQTYEQAESALKGAQIAYDSAKMSYDNTLEYSSVTAPISGRIESSSMEVHGMATSASSVCVIAGEGGKTVSFYITEGILDMINVGDEITIEKGGAEHNGTVTEVSTMVDAATGLFKVKATVKDTDSFANGSSVKVYVISERADNVMVIPTDSVYYENGNSFVYTYVDGTVHEVYIDTGLSDTDNIEVISGLDNTDMVITTWSPELYEGAPVKLTD